MNINKPLNDNMEFVVYRRDLPGIMARLNLHIQSLTEKHEKQTLFSLMLKMQQANFKCESTYCIPFYEANMMRFVLEGHYGIKIPDLSISLV
jgi:hypothetical protein